MPVPKILRDAQTTILALPEPARLSYARALVSSLYHEARNTDASNSAIEISEAYVISLEELADKKIAIGKDNAHQFLQQIGCGITLSKVRRRFSAEKYTSIFRGRKSVKKKPSKLGERKLIFTYGEVLHLASYYSFGSALDFLDDELKQYLEGDPVLAAKGKFVE